MIDHEYHMRLVESRMHGTMTESERLRRISTDVENWKIAIEEETGKPF